MTVDVSHIAAGPGRVAARQRRLRVVNIAVGLTLALEGVLMLMLSNTLALPITASYLTNDPVAVRGPTMPERLFALPIGPTVAVFLCWPRSTISGAAPGAQQWYVRSLEARSNYARWIEYSVSASIMIVLIGLFVGIRDLAAVIAIFAANTAMILFGLLMERQQQPGRADWSAFWFGSLIGVVPWSWWGSMWPGRPRCPDSCTRSPPPSSSCSSASPSTWPCSTERWAVAGLVVGEASYSPSAWSPESRSG